MKAMAVEDRHLSEEGNPAWASGTQTSGPDTPQQRWERETWNIEVWSVDVKAGGHWGILLVLHLPVLRRELGEWQDPR